MGSICLPGWRKEARPQLRAWLLHSASYDFLRETDRSIGAHVDGSALINETQHTVWRSEFGRSPIGRNGRVVCGARSDAVLRRSRVW